MKVSSRRPLFVPCALKNNFCSIATMIKTLSVLEKKVHYFANVAGEEKINKKINKLVDRIAEALSKITLTQLRSASIHELKMLSQALTQIYDECGIFQQSRIAKYGFYSYEAGFLTSFCFRIDFMIFMKSYKTRKARKEAGLYSFNGMDDLHLEDLSDGFKPLHYDSKIKNIMEKLNIVDDKGYFTM
jgi:hypothetical protein